MLLKASVSKGLADGSQTPVEKCILVRKGVSFEEYEDGLCYTHLVYLGSRENTMTHWSDVSIHKLNHVIAGESTEGEVDELASSLAEGGKEFDPQGGKNFPRLWVTLMIVLQVAATKCVSWALNSPRIHYRRGLHPQTPLGELKRSHRPLPISGGCFTVGEMERGGKREEGKRKRGIGEGKEGGKGREGKRGGKERGRRREREGSLRHWR